MPLSVCADKQPKTKMMQALDRCNTESHRVHQALRVKSEMKSCKQKRRAYVWIVSMSLNKNGVPFDDCV